MRMKIVSDSSSDILSMEGVAFASAPLKIITTEKEYVDDETLDVKEMVEDLLAYKGRSSTSCPNTADWINAFGDAERIFCITITGTLSGSYNAACAAKDTYEALHPDRKVFVINSLSTGPEILLIMEKLAEYINERLDFETICEKITQYKACTHLIFMLESMKNLANNGRVSPLVAKMAGILGIRVIGKASEKGDLEQLDKVRGQTKSIEKLVQHIEAIGFTRGKIRIAHCFNEEAARELQKRLNEKFVEAKVQINRCRGLCSFYAEKGGMLVGFETV